MSIQHLHILFRREEESWLSFRRRIRETDGEMIVILQPDDQAKADGAEQETFLEEIAKIRYRIRLAAKHPLLVRAAKKRGIHVFTRTSQLKRALQDHPQADEALRLFSPHLWRQLWRSRLQNIGILSLPKLRIWSLIAVSGALFVFVVFRLLPSAEIRVSPRQDSITQTTNVFLALSSGSTLSVPPQARIMPLIPISVTVRKRLMFDQISKEFTGKDARVPMMIINTTDEPYGFKKGTRLKNQAGMIFRIQQAVSVPAKGNAVVPAKADPQDIYGEDIGSRGNVPAGLKWTFPGLSAEEQEKVYAQNKAAAVGGETSSRKVLQPKDLQVARKKLEQELLASAKQKIEEEREKLNRNTEDRQLEFLNKDDVIRAEYSNFILPTHLLGQSGSSVPIEGSLTYRVFTYDAVAIVKMLATELSAHVVEGKRLLPSSFLPDRLKVYIIAYGDDLSWVKLTADFAATEEFILDPFTPSGAQFARKVREQTAGMPVKDALRVIRNFPEVEKAEVHLWPPWAGALPPIPSHISIKLL